MRIFNDPNPDDLSDYVNWVFNDFRFNLARPLYPFNSYEPATGLILHRDGNFQVEMFSLPGKKGIPPHDHPDVDSVECAMGGDFHLYLDGKSVMSGHTRPGHCARVFQNKGVRINAGLTHAASVGPEGVGFLSCQRWLNGVEPTSIGQNWSGKTYSQEEAHEA